MTLGDYINSWALLTNTITGVAFLAYPFLFRIAGWPSATVALIIIAVAELLSLQMMEEGWNKVRSPKDLHLRTFIGGSQTSAERKGLLIWTYDILVVLSCFGGLIPYTMTVADCLQGLILPAYAGATAGWFRAVMVIGFTVFQYPLSAFVTFEGQAPASITSLCILVVIALLVGTHANYEHLHVSEAPPVVGHPPLLSNNPASIIAAVVSNMIFSFTCQMNCFESYRVLMLGRGKFNHRVAVGFINFFAILFSAVVYWIVGYFGNLDFDGDTQTNILNNYGSQDAFGIALRLMVILKMFLTYPIILSPIARSMPGLHQRLGKPLLVAVIIIPASTVAIFVYDLSMVLGFLGSITEVFICFGLPPLLLVYLNILKPETFNFVLSILFLYLGPFVAVFGVVGLALSLV